jgi:hypothetical protein
MLPAEARAQVEDQAGEVIYAESMLASPVRRQSA